MKRSIYYGEYTLIHWIELILKKNIRIPKYQRYFVWNRKKVSNLIDALKNDQFVPPITIGVFKVGDESINYILDGQQRLTSILLAYLKLFPKKPSEVKDILMKIADENDDIIDDNSNIEDIIDWTFEKLTAIGKTRVDIQERYNKDLYDEVDYGNSNSFFYNKYLGFSYIVPEVNDEKEQQKYYSSVFRNINLQGVHLLATESRKSLYFLDKSLENFFEPQLDKVKIVTSYGSTKIDFVRYLSLLSQYCKENRADKVSKGFSQKKLEEYYEEYIYSVVNEKNSDIFESFERIFPNRNFHNEFDKMRAAIDAIIPTTGFTSIIDMDIFMFGLIYQTVFVKHEIDLNRKEELIQYLKSTISIYKTDDKHKKTPSLLMFLRSRLSKSLEIYANYAVTPL